MRNEQRMAGFETMYAKLVEGSPEAVKACRFDDHDSYSLPRTAHAYRVYCATLDSVFHSPYLGECGLPSESAHHSDSVNAVLDAMIEVKNRGE